LWIDEEPSASGGVRRDEFDLDLGLGFDGLGSFEQDVEMGDGSEGGGGGRGGGGKEGKRSRMKPKDWEAAMS